MDAELEPGNSIEAGATQRRRVRVGSFGSITYLIVLMWAAVISSAPLNDNSFFTHLATGRLVLNSGDVPSRDPFSFTAADAPWTVQSWLVSVLYAGAERFGGELGLRLVVLGLFTTAITLIWILTRTAPSMVVRLSIMTGVMVVATGLWGERPYMVGVIGLGVTLLALDSWIRPWVLVPVMAIWVNSHGSWVLAPVLIGLVILGTVLDQREAAVGVAASTNSRSVGLASLVGILLGALGPLGPRILLFPVAAISRSDVFETIFEWQPPTYRSTSERAFLFLALVSLVLISRHGSWRLAIPTVAFSGAAMYAQRNVVMATVVLAWAAAQCAPSVGTLRANWRPPLGRITAATLTALCAAIAVVAIATPLLPAGSLVEYPTRSLAWLQASAAAPDGRLAGGVFTGNLLAVLDGEDGEVFVDDRVDMYPATVFTDFLHLRRGGLDWARILIEYDIDTVVWERQAPLGSLVAESEAWSVVFSDARWLVAHRRD